MKRWTAKLCLAAIASAALMMGCSKPASDTPPTPEPGAPPKQGASPSPTPAKPPAPPKPTPIVPKRSPEPEPQPKASTLEQQYNSVTDSAEKTEVLYKLGEIETREAVETLGRLFQQETDPELKEETLNVLSITEGFEREKIAIYKVAVQPSQPEDVRKAAIDGLSDLEDPAALPVLQELLKDPSAQIREAAKDAIDLSAATAAAP